MLKNATRPLVILGILGLILVYLFQHQLNVWGWLHGSFDTWYDTFGTMQEGPKGQTIVNKTVRYLLNDLFSICIIHGLFRKREYTKLAIGLLLFGLLVLLPSYFIVLFYAPSGFSSMISHLHRIILNPVLMMMLIPYLWYVEKNKATEDASSEE